MEHHSWFYHGLESTIPGWLTSWLLWCRTVKTECKLSEKFWTALKHFTQTENKENYQLYKRSFWVHLEYACQSAARVNVALAKTDAEYRRGQDTAGELRWMHTLIRIITSRSDSVGNKWKPTKILSNYSRWYLNSFGLNYPIVTVAYRKI